MIPLFYLSDVKYGGWPTFTAHLAYGLGDAQIVKIGNRTESKARSFGRGLSYQNLDLDTAVQLASKGIVVVASPKQVERADALVRAGAALVIHDPTEVKGDAGALVAKARTVITIRERNLPMLRALGADPVFIPHPYLRSEEGALGVRATEWDHRRSACSISRIDFDKHTEIIAEANRILRPTTDLDAEDFQIAIFGEENRLYAHHKLDTQFPEWRAALRGRFDSNSLHAAASIAERYRAVVDMSVIVGDGGGTQYTHLEALDAGCRLILNEGWRGGEVDAVAEYVSDAAALSAAVRSTEPPADGQAMLREHEAGVVAMRYRGFIL